VFLALVVGMLEVALRAFPGELVPLKFLKRFQREVRLEIAQRLRLPTELETWELPRDDGGPTLLLRRPFTRLTFDFREENEKGEVVLDSQGFCNPPRDSYERAEIELIAIGDSFTECLVTDPAQTWPSQIGEITGRAVYSFGRGGIGPYEYVQVLKSLGLPKHPRAVVMNVYEGNDLRDSLRYHQYVNERRSGREIRMVANDRNEDPIDYEAVLDHPLGRRSYAVNLLTVAGGRGYEGVRNLLVRGPSTREKVNFRYTLRFPEQEVPFNRQDADESEVRHARMLRAGSVSLAAFDEALETFAALAREHGFQPVVAYSPSAYTAYADFVAFDDGSLAELMPWFSGEQRRYLARRATELELIFVDLTPALQQAARSLEASELLYYPVNVHYTPRGHRVVAEALAKEMERLLPGAPTAVVGGREGSAAPARAPR
jgi:hypothetical protein